MSSYVTCNTDGETGAQTAIWALRICTHLVAISPILLGLVILSRRQWVIGAVSIATGIAILLFVEGLPRLRRRKTASASREQAVAFYNALMAWTPDAQLTAKNQDTARGRRRSNATIFELITALHPRSEPPTARDGQLPLPSDAIDDLINPRLAAWANPLAERPPELPPLDEVESTNTLNASRTMYPPSLVAPSPVIWLPDDKNGIGRLEASDLVRHHQLDAMVDVVKS